MSDLRAALMTAVRRSQRGTPVVVGGRYVRGRRLVTVVDVEDGTVSWRDDGTDVETTGTRAEFLGIAVDRLRLDIDPDAPADLLATAWALASTTTIDAGERYALLQDLYADVLAGRTGTDEERAALRRWMMALLHRNEPTEEPEAS